MKVNAKCHNYSGCLQAYRGEELELDAGAPLVCPECGKPLTIVKPAASPLWKIVPIVLVVALLAIGFFLARPLLFGPAPDEPTPAPVTAGDAPAIQETPAQTTTSGASSSPAPVQPVRDTTAQPSEPPQEVTKPEKIDLDAQSGENKKVKQDVLTRIDVMPNISEGNKDKLYNSVERARSMGKVLTIPFGSGKIALSAADVQAMKTQLEIPEIKKLRDDPTAVFVILGYADPKGDQQKNLAISQTRADTVLEAMRDKAGVMNVMHAVGMGGSTLLDAENLEKNRIAEVWVVLP